MTKPKLPEVKPSKTPKQEAAAKEEARTKRIYLPAKERRRMIIEAAQEAFAENTLEGVSTRNLAKAAQVNIATLFQHFDSKEELFVAAVVEPMLKNMRHVYSSHILEDAIESDKFGTEIMPLLESSLKTMTDAFPLLAAALFSDGKLGRKLYREQIAPLLKRRGDHLQEMLGDDIDGEFLCLAGFGIELAIGMDRYFRKRTDDLGETAIKVRDLMFREKTMPRPKKKD